VAAPIPSLKPGEKILATNVRTGQTSAEPVTAVLVYHDTNRCDLTLKPAYGTAVGVALPGECACRDTADGWRKRSGGNDGYRCADSENR